MEKTALKCSSCDDLMRYANKLDALGYILGELAFHDSEALTNKGQELGNTISDYAKAINNVLGDLYPTIERVFDNGDTSLLSELKTTQKNIHKGYMGLHENRRLAKESVEKINVFLNNDLKQLIDLKNEFEKIGESITNKLIIGQALARADDQAKAPDVDQDRSTIQ